MTNSIPSVLSELLNSGAASSGTAAHAALLDAVPGAGNSLANFLQLLGQPTAPASNGAPGLKQSVTNATTIPASDATAANPLSQANSTAATPSPAGFIRGNPVTTGPFVFIRRPVSPATPPSGAIASATANLPAKINLMPETKPAESPSDSAAAVNALPGSPTASDLLTLAEMSASAGVERTCAMPAKTSTTSLTRDQLEAAAALLAPLLQILQTLPTAGGTAPEITVQLNGQTPVKLGVLPNASETSAASPHGSAQTLALSPEALKKITEEIAKALDNLPKLTTPGGAAVSAQSAAEAASPSNPTRAPELEAAALSATIALPDGQTLHARIELPKASAINARGGAESLPEKIAVHSNAEDNTSSNGNSAGEKKFLSDDRKQFGRGGDEDGITVALPATIMTTTLFERQSASEKGSLSLAQVGRSEFMVPASAQAEQTEPGSMAHRAVAAVISAVEAQTISRLQPVPSVHLRLNLGGEDLSIKVQMRAGQVTTEFQTNSPELRSAIAREWQAVGAESPDRALRFLEPVYAAGNPGGQGGSASGQQGQSSPQHYSRPSSQDVFGTVSRAYPFRESESDLPARGALPAFQSNSLHLSVVA